MTWKVLYISSAKVSNGVIEITLYRKRVSAGAPKLLCQIGKPNSNVKGWKKCESQFIHNCDGATEASTAFRYWTFQMHAWHCVSNPFAWVRFDLTFSFLFFLTLVLDVTYCLPTVNPQYKKIHKVSMNTLMLLEYPLVQIDLIKEHTTNFKILQLPFHSFLLIPVETLTQNLLEYWKDFFQIPRSFTGIWKSLSFTPCAELLLNLVGILELQENVNHGKLLVKT